MPILTVFWRDFYTTNSLAEIIIFFFFLKAENYEEVIAATSSGDYEGSGDTTNNNNCDNEDGCGEGDLGPKTSASIMPTPSISNTVAPTLLIGKPTNAAKEIIDATPTSQIPLTISSTSKKISSEPIQPSLSSNLRIEISSDSLSLPPIYEHSTTESSTKIASTISTTDGSNVEGKVFGTSTTSPLLTTDEESSNIASTTMTPVVVTAETTERSETPDLLVTSSPSEVPATTTKDGLVIPGIIGTDNITTTETPKSSTENIFKTSYKNNEISTSTVPNSVETDITAAVATTGTQPRTQENPFESSTTKPEVKTTENPGSSSTSEPIVVIGDETHSTANPVITDRVAKTDSKIMVATGVVTEIRISSTEPKPNAITAERVNTPVVITGIMESPRTTLAGKITKKVQSSSPSKPLMGTTLKTIIKTKTITKASTPNILIETTRSDENEETIRRTNAVNTKESNNENEIDITVPTRDPNNRVQDPVIADVSSSKSARLSITSMYVLSLTCVSAIVLSWLI